LDPAPGAATPAVQPAADDGSAPSERAAAVGGPT
jgi:hypothetical protein